MEKSLKDTVHSMFPTWWLSFCDTDKKPGNQFVGVIITKAFSLQHAVHKIHQLGINPGGEIKAFEIDGIDEKYYNKLMNKKELTDANLI